jgi:hypothetical protein
MKGSLEPNQGAVLSANARTRVMRDRYQSRCNRHPNGLYMDGPSMERQGNGGGMRVQKWIRRAPGQLVEILGWKSQKRLLPKGANGQTISFRETANMVTCLQWPCSWATVQKCGSTV